MSTPDMRLRRLSITLAPVLTHRALNRTPPTVTSARELFQLRFPIGTAPGRSADER